MREKSGKYGVCMNEISMCWKTEYYKPRLSAAMTTPSLNLTARTEVPVTTGDCV